MAKIAAIEGIGDVTAEKFALVGITTTEALLDACATAAGRKELAAKTGLDASQLLGWANRADLFRIKGIGTQYSDLLEASGVDTVPELAQRNAENLHAKMTEVNAAKKLVRQLPTLRLVQGWVAQAKELPRMIGY
ncbi:MAG: DUF4332 domain-containing protein [Caldilineaceae bacterium]|nr:DUF4332 domain-containing protein [Caldilineaceae bacterium]HRJ42725.1 DUF4332 domain-containing protein [Caldilineaceae bacterium]